MLKRVELQHKVRLNGDEYDILLSDESNFKSAFDTLNYILGEYTKNENTLIGFDTDDHLSVFKSGGHRNIYFYEDRQKLEPKRKEFVESVLEKHPTSRVHIIVCVPEENSLLFDVYRRCCDITGNSEDLQSKTSVHSIVDYTLDEISTKIVIGA